MPSQFNSLSPVLILAGAFWATQATAVSVPYNFDDHAPKGPIIFQQILQHPFVSILQSPDKHRAEVLKSFQREEKDTHVRWGKGAGHGKSQLPGKHRDDGPSDTAADTSLSDYDFSGGSVTWVATTYPGPLTEPYFPTMNMTATFVPVPATIWLFLSGIIGLGLARRSRRW